MKNNSASSIQKDFAGKDILSIDQFSPDDLQILFSHTAQMAPIAKNASPANMLAGTIVSLLFYEPSSRTFGSFIAAVKQLGGQTVEIVNPQQFSSVSKGESLEDTIKVFEAYSDAIIIRHSEKGTAWKAAESAQFVPVINAGDGTGEHPTQALLDLYTIYEKYGRLNNLIGVMAGDMLNGRTIHSLIKGLSLYKNNTLYLLAPKELQLAKEDFADLSNRGIKLIEIGQEKDIPKNANFWYWTRVQKERFKSNEEYERVKNKFVLNKILLDQYGNEDTIIMHPLPRVGEISQEVDSDKRAVYLKSQVRNGMYVRMALLGLVLGKL